MLLKVSSYDVTAIDLILVVAQLTIIKNSRFIPIKQILTALAISSCIENVANALQEFGI